MATPSIDDLLQQWENARAGGEALTPEQLCTDCPEQVEAVRRAISDLTRLEPMLTTGPVVPVTSPTASNGPPSVPAAAFAGVRYRPEAFHRQGGQGEVYVARDEELNRPVALKRIQDRHRANPDIRRRFLREAEINGRLEHPGIVPVYGLGRDADGQPFYAMRLIQGQSLQEAIAKFHTGAGERALAFRKLLGHFVAVCNAAAYAHSRGVIHRDIKPANVMLGPYGETLLIDWGMAKAVGRPPEVREQSLEETLAPRTEPGDADTAFGAVAGTPAFMSPEQAAGRTEAIGTWSDIYGLGATLYAVLTGTAPAEGKLFSILERVQAGQVPPPRAVKPNVPPALDAVCRKAMAPRRADRYPTPQALAGDVERWLADEPATAWREPRRVRARRWVQRHRTLAAVTAAAILFVALVTSLGLLTKEREWARRSVADEQTEVQRARDAREAALVDFIWRLADTPMQ
jgi:tRNA A-37 threonylcarbamoyl transferase component Bud32